MHTIRPDDTDDYFNCLERSLVRGFVANVQPRGAMTLAALIAKAELDAAAYPEWADQINATIIKLQMLTPEQFAEVINTAEGRGR